MELECKYRTKEDGTLYTENKYPKIVEELYAIKEMTMRIPEPFEHRALFHFTSALEDALFEGNGNGFECFLKSHKKDLLRLLDAILPQKKLKGALTWAVRGRLERVIKMKGIMA